ncbi:MAG: sugar phosphate isomerase/epimerase [Anaerolineae bacterium]|nr:sugar phosphate isomerase/epimerase [Anaerolineae bacterium]
MKLGCSTILFGGYSLDEALDGIAKAGYKAIELCARPGMAPHVEMDRPASYYAEIKQRITDRGLVIESLAGTGGISLDSDEFPRALEVAHMLGAPMIAEGAGGNSPAVEDDSFKPEYETSLKDVVDILNKAADQAMQFGVKLTIKPHVGTAIYSRKSILKAVPDLNQEWIGINFDPTHIWRSGTGEDPVETLRAVKKYIFTLRIRDNRASRERPIGSVENQIAGKGALDLPALTAEMKTIEDRVPYATLEIVGTHNGTGWALEAVQDVIGQCFTYLEPLLA